MNFDDIPEDLKHCEPCPVDGCNGSVSKNESDIWECDTCKWQSGGSDIVCPFCKEKDFDLIGLKAHFENN